MSAISFPSGMIAATASEFLFPELGVLSRQNTVVIIWLSMVIAGALQWFIVVPAVCKWLKKKWTKRG
jgi:hypothetical protein